LRALARVLPLERAVVWARGDASEFAQRLSQQLNIAVHSTADLKAATRQSDVIVTCTPARHWFLGREHVVPGTFIAAVGADSPDKQELEPELLATASVVCDLTDQCAQVGDLHHAIAGGLTTVDKVRGELGEVIVGQAPKRQRDDEIIVFDSTGTALQDVAAAARVYEGAVSVGRGMPFGFWP
jgi:alanine dehydrogenase